jgi:phosphoglycerate dehydrogenase-like enzyme
VWSGTPVPLWSELAGKTLAIVGYGRIGQAVARRALAFDMEVLALRRDAGRPDPNGLAFVRGPEALADVLGRADFLALTLALTPDTRGLIDARALARMKRGAVLINVARAEVVDEDALYDALHRGALAGAALDVWYRYPQGPEPTPPGHRPFHTLPNVLMTPHVSGWTEGMMDSRAAVIAENIHRVARGEAPVNLVRRDGGGA